MGFAALYPSYDSSSRPHVVGCRDPRQQRKHDQDCTQRLGWKPLRARLQPSFTVE
jgi:hypothetical protein